MERALAGRYRRPRPRPATVAGVLGGITFLAFVLGIVRLDFQPLWWDEGYSVWFATHPLPQMAALTAEDIHPPLYYALLHGWTRVFGAGPVALRLLSVAFGVLGVPAVYLAARRMAPAGSRRFPLLAALLLAINPLHVFYSQEVRMYGLVALLSTGVLAAAWGILDEGRTTKDERPGLVLSSFVVRLPSFVIRPSSYLAYILLTTAALYTQYYAVFLPLGLTLVAIWRWRRDLRALAAWLAAQAAVALLYLPWGLYAAPRLIPYVSQKVAADADRPLGLLTYLGRHLSAFLAGHLEGPLAPYWPVPLLLLIPLAAGWWWARGTEDERRKTKDGEPAGARPRGAAAMLAVVLATALVAGWLIGLRYPFFPARGERLLLLALPAFVLLAAAGLAVLWQRLRIAGYVTCALILAVSAASLAAFYVTPRYADDDYRPLIARTVEQGLPGDTVFCVYPWQAGYWRAYAPADGPAARLSPDAAWGPGVEAALDGLLVQGRVWFPAHLALGAVLESRVEAHLAGRAWPFVNEWHGSGTRLSAWSAAAGPDAALQTSGGSLPIRFALPRGGTLALAALDWSTQPVPAANAVTPVALTWQADAVPSGLAASVRLVNDLEQIWAQHDYEPLGGLSRAAAAPRGSAWQAEDRLGLLVPAGTPPGRYHLEVVVHPAGSELPLEAFTADGRSLGASPRLADLEVSPADRELAPGRLPIASPQVVELGDGLRFLGHSAAGGPLAPGAALKVSLFWQAVARPAADYVAFVQLLGADGAPVALWEAPPGAAWPTSAWAAGALMRTQAALRIPAAVADGRYRLIAGLFRAADRTRLATASGADRIMLGRVTVRGRAHVMAPPQVEHAAPAGAAFGDVARLVGYDLDLPDAGVEPGGTLHLTLHWQALAATERPYTVFVHLVDGAGAIRGYGDSEPGAGALPTTGWLAGEYLVDTHTLSVSPEATAGEYRVAVGFYDPATGQRLAAAGGADQIVLDTPVVIR